MTPQASASLTGNLWGELLELFNVPDAGSSPRGSEVGAIWPRCDILALSRFSPCRVSGNALLFSRTWDVDPHGIVVAPTDVVDTFHMRGSARDAISEAARPIVRANRQCTWGEDRLSGSSRS